MITHKLSTNNPPAGGSACPLLQVVVVFAPTGKIGRAGGSQPVHSHTTTAGISACPHLQVVVVSCAPLRETLIAWAGCSQAATDNQPSHRLPSHLQVVVVFAPLRNLHWLGWLLATVRWNQRLSSAAGGGGALCTLTLHGLVTHRLLTDSSPAAFSACPLLQGYDGALCMCGLPIATCNSRRPSALCTRRHCSITLLVGAGDELNISLSAWVTQCESLICA